ncbi:glycosyltransferase family 2 protein [Weissella confusa]|uniref:glycosyltransferase family 2 protein n=1 Tax=Weissella confusa TaxID=1583 RepID=UPI0022FF11C1|nr:glycosyltransferase family 2 protein [Weissella confusa]
MVDVSIVVPVYNMVGLMESGVASLLNQTYDSLEIIFVDDGSTDNSLDYLENLSSATKEIRVFSKPNGGLAAARNYGVSKVRGKYLLFFDPDDSLREDAIEKMMTTVSKQQSMLDILVFNTIDLDFKSGIEIKKVTHGTLPENAGSVAWNKLFRTDFWKENFEFPVDVRFEDTGIIPFAVAKATNIFILNEFLYFYRKNRNGSLLTTANGHAYKDELATVERLLHLAKDSELNKSRKHSLYKFTTKKIAHTILKYSSTFDRQRFSVASLIFDESYVSFLKTQVESEQLALQMYFWAIGKMLKFKFRFGLLILNKIKG